MSDNRPGKKSKPAQPAPVRTNRFVPRIRAANLPQGTEGFNELTYEEPKQRPVAFVDLERHHCRWPADAGFCGVQVSDGKSYCGYHQKAATRR